MSKLTDVIFIRYLATRCELLTRPRCSECEESDGLVYRDECAGEDYCESCLRKDLEKDHDMIKEIAQELK